jgi:hypothetical protein
MKRFMLVASVLAVLISNAAPSVHAQANPQGGAEHFTLTGVIFSEGGGGLAWLQEPKLTNNQVVGVRRGESVGPYRLTAIFEDRVELEGPAGKLFVPLYGPSSPQTAVASPPPAPVGASLAAQLQELANQQRSHALVEPATPAPMGDPRRQEGLGALLNQLRQ